MRKIMEYICISFLICFSFFYTDNVIDMVNKKDPLMSEIVNIKDSYEVLPVNAILEQDTIIPGVSGREIDVDKSYENMKLGGIFREEALIFKDLHPSDTLSENRDKYIVKGSNYKNNVAIITIFNNSNIDKIKDMDDITIFINHKDLNIKNINTLKEKEIYTYGNNGLYNEEILTSDNTLINRMSNNKSNYCLTEKKDDSVLEVCSERNMYTVIPNIIGGYYAIRSDLSNGSIILLDNLNDIDIIVRYIKSKGYDIVTLSNLLSE